MQQLILQKLTKLKGKSLIRTERGQQPLETCTARGKDIRTESPEPESRIEHFDEGVTRPLLAI